MEQREESTASGEERGNGERRGRETCKVRRGVQTKDSTARNENGTATKETEREREEQDAKRGEK